MKKLIIEGTKEADEIIYDNIRDAFENGPRIRYSPTIGVARCYTGKHIMKGGYGAFGVGTMWSEATADERSDPEFSRLPVCQCEISLAFSEVCPPTGDDTTQ
jgi:hypothetical protein